MSATYGHLDRERLNSHNGRRLEDLLTEGWAALRDGEAARAADVFSRVRLLDPRHGEAVRGEAEARALLDEGQRLQEARLAEDDADRARQARASRIEPSAEPPALIAEAAAFPLPSASAGPSSRRRTWSRITVAAGWTIGFGLLAAGVASSWENLVGRLAGKPTPQSEPAPPVTALPMAPHGERLLADARRLLDAGDLAGALAALDRVSPEEPAYPLARKLRDEAQTLARSGGRRR
jgi:hypothetical protein